MFFFPRLRETPHVQLVVLRSRRTQNRQVFSSELLRDVRGVGWRLGKGTLHTTPMACYDLCRPCGPTPLANSCNEPCALQCQDSHVVINPSPVLITLPGPIMTSFPQNTAVGSTSSAAVGNELSAQGQPISGGFGGFGYGLGYGRGFGYGLGGLGCYGRRGGYIC
uniref:Keratin n=2 Tax=Corvus moneduloides TaxID=1196302 RepID=A0A8U7MDL6_CORMO